MALKEGVKRALEYIAQGVLVFLRAPTGYGKSFLSIVLAKMIYECEEFRRSIAAYRVIHVLPFKSIVEDLYRRAVSVWGEGHVGYQASIDLGSAKDPIFRRRLIYTTLDSFVLNFSKITPLRTERATYEAARASIYTSVVIFDEAHLYATPKALAAIKTMLESLTKAKAPVIVATATMPSSLVDKLVGSVDVKLITVVKEGAKYKPKPGEEVVEEKLPDKRLAVKRIKCGEVERVVRDALRSRKFVVVVKNRVDDAVSLYNKLRDLNPLLLHGRLTFGDRRNVIREVLENREENVRVEVKCPNKAEVIEEERKKDSSKEGILISTQVVEAGVNIDADVLITDLAPLPNLVQRAGRVARFKNEGEMYVAECDCGPYPSEECEFASNYIDKIKEWKAPDYGDEENYAWALEEYGRKFYEGLKPHEEVAVASKMLDNVITLHRRDAEKELERLCSFVREETLVPVLNIDAIEQADALDVETVKDETAVLDSDYLCSYLQEKFKGISRVTVYVEVEEKIDERCKMLREKSAYICPVDVEMWCNCKTLLTLERALRRLHGRAFRVVGLGLRGYIKGVGWLLE